MNDFVFLSLCLEFFLESSVLLQFFYNLGFGIRSPDRLILDFDVVDFALVYQFLVLIVSDLSLCACFKLLPSFFLYHSSVGIEILSLEFNFFQFFGKSIFFLFLVFLFLAYFFINFLQAFFSGCFHLSFKFLFLLLLLLFLSNIVFLPL